MAVPAPMKPTICQASLHCGLLNHTGRTDLARKYESNQETNRIQVFFTTDVSGDLCILKIQTKHVLSLSFGGRGCRGASL